MQVTVTETYSPQATYNFPPEELAAWIVQLPEGATLALVDHAVKATWTKEVEL